MKRHEALKRFDELSADGKDAVIFGGLAEYLLAQDAEALIELVTEGIALAGIDEWKHLRDCLARKDTTMLGEAVLSICAGLLETLEEERGELSRHIEWEHEDAMAKHPRRVCGGLLPFDDDLGGRAA